MINEEKKINILRIQQDVCIFRSDPNRIQNLAVRFCVKNLLA
jgi:hypothetical protein